ncbi:hypothetical protein HMPREF0294_1443 [Corynebacterium glucuronolyticum ATCC 51867]|nr:hypothetical protein HMPREF0294_1443 [Corynebacterium glucuronolyticum ATCC 51867]
MLRHRPLGLSFLNYSGSDLADLTQQLLTRYFQAGKAGIEFHGSRVREIN